VIELDGGQHAERQSYDAARWKFLESRGLFLRRF
jgi:very-short-patch-repair endonuclease